MIKSVKDGAVLEFSEYSGDYFEAWLRTAKYEGRERVYAYEVQHLCGYFQEMGDSWRGWKGTKVWESLEGQLLFSASSDSTGHVILEVTIRQVDSLGWQLKGYLEIEAGQLEAVARSVNKMFSEGERS